MTNRQIRRMIELAKNISEFSDMPDYKLGCVIFDTHKVWALGYNKKRPALFSDGTIDIIQDGKTARKIVPMQRYALFLIFLPDGSLRRFHSTNCPS